MGVEGFCESDTDQDDVVANQDVLALSRDLGFIIHEQKRHFSRCLDAVVNVELA